MVPPVCARWTSGRDRLVANLQRANTATSDRPPSWQRRGTPARRPGEARGRWNQDTHRPPSHVVLPVAHIPRHPHIVVDARLDLAPPLGMGSPELLTGSNRCSRRPTRSLQGHGRDDRLPIASSFTAPSCLHHPFICLSAATSPRSRRRSPQSVRHFTGPVRR
jgi:hypothetical protein